MFAIRSGTKADLPALVHIEEATATLFPEADLPRELAHPMPAAVLRRAMAHGLLWTAEIASGRVVGFVVCERCADGLHILEMDVHPDFGRRGLGSAFLQQAVAQAAASGFDHVTLTTFEHLAWNAPFYARRGFAALTDLSPWPRLAAILETERAKGLRRRVAMVRRVAA